MGRDLFSPSQLPAVQDGLWIQCEQGVGVLFTISRSDEAAGFIEARMPVLGVMRVTGHDVDESMVQQAANGGAGGAAEAAGDRKRRDLNQATQIHPFFQTAAVALEHRIPLRMGHNGDDPAVDQALQYPLGVLPHVEIRAFHQ